MIKEKGREYYCDLCNRRIKIKDVGHTLFLCSDDVLSNFSFPKACVEGMAGFEHSVAGSCDLVKHICNNCSDLISSVKANPKAKAKA